MLKITADQLAGLQDAQLRALGRRVDAWMVQVSPRWARQPADRRETEMAALMRQAGAAGMLVETDCALFAWVMLAKGPNWRAFAGRKQVAEVFEADDWAPQSKIVRLHELAGAPAFGARED